MRWPQLMLHWETVEKESPTYAQKKKNYRFFKRIRVYAIVMMVMIHSKIFGLFLAEVSSFAGISFRLIFQVEHAMSKTAGFQRSIQCNGKGNLQGYLMQAWPQINLLYDRQEEGYITLAVEAVNYYCTFMWTYMDLFIITISICLSNRLRQFNKNLQRFRGLAMSSTFWMQQRTYFGQLTHLIAEVDENISVITVLSLSNNFYCILVQLLHSFE